MSSVRLRETFEFNETPWHSPSCLRRGKEYVMVRQKYKKTNHTSSDEIVAAVEKMLRLQLSGCESEGRKLRRTLIGKIRSELEKRPNNPRLWCQLGDIYTVREKRMDCFRRALRPNQTTQR